MSISIDQKMRRTVFIETLKKWIRVFEDDILAEASAVNLYLSHIRAFVEDFKIPASHAPVKQPLSVDKEVPMLKANSGMLGVNIGVSPELAREILQRLHDMIIGPSLSRGDPHQDHSVRNIILEELDHSEEFMQMQKDLQEVIAKLGM